MMPGPGRGVVRRHFGCCFSAGALRGALRASPRWVRVDAESAPDRVRLSGASLRRCAAREDSRPARPDHGTATTSPSTSITTGDGPPRLHRRDKSLVGVQIDPGQCSTTAGCSSGTDLGRARARRKRDQLDGRRIRDSIPHASASRGPRQRPGACGWRSATQHAMNDVSSWGGGVGRFWEAGRPGKNIHAGPGRPTSRGPSRT